MKYIKYIFIDEKSMMSLKMLSFLDQRLRQIRPDQANVAFAGFGLVIWGDYFQLPPVRALALYNNGLNLKGEHAVQGQVL